MQGVSGVLAYQSCQASAAASGKLNTREDYQREILRLLKSRDSTWLIDTVLNDKNYPENTTQLPIRKLRFFREFFGYPKATEVFKDDAFSCFTFDHVSFHRLRKKPLQFLILINFNLHFRYFIIILIITNNIILIFFFFFIKK